MVCKIAKIMSIIVYSSSCDYSGCIYVVEIYMTSHFVILNKQLVKYCL